MVNRRNYLMLLFVAICSVLSVNAQDIKLYRFVCRDAGQSNTKHALYHNTDNNKAVTTIIQSDNLELSDYTEMFIVKRQSNTGFVLIASAKKPEMFLKHNAVTGELIYTPLGDSDDKTDYLWQFNFAGNSSILISPKNSADKALLVNNGNLSISELKGSNNQPASASNNVADKFTFKLEFIKNVL
ncbi:MAG: hypothetical protein N4A72_16100 [Bacteroidales bacterium]|jgi:hypothetical protein|nr:hypothetical protein [Bacteroidales bacterium]